MLLWKPPFCRVGLFVRKNQYLKYQRDDFGCFLPLLYKIAGFFRYPYADGGFRMIPWLSGVPLWTDGFSAVDPGLSWSLVHCSTL